MAQGSNSPQIANKLKAPSQKTNSYNHLFSRDFLVKLFLFMNVGILWQGREILQCEKSRFRETVELSHCVGKFHQFHCVISLSRVNDWNFFMILCVTVFIYVDLECSRRGFTLQYLYNIWRFCWKLLWTLISFGAHKHNTVGVRWRIVS